MLEVGTQYISKVTTSGDVLFWNDIPLPDENVGPVNIAKNIKRKTPSKETERIEFLKKDILSTGFIWTDTELYRYCKKMNIRITRKLYQNLKNVMLKINSPTLRKCTFRDGTRDKLIRWFLMYGAFKKDRVYFLDALLKANEELMFVKNYCDYEME